MQSWRPAILRALATGESLQTREIGEKVYGTADIMSGDLRPILQTLRQAEARGEVYREGGWMAWWRITDVGRARLSPRRGYSGPGS